MSELVLTEQERTRAGARLTALLEGYERDLSQARLLPEPDRDRLTKLLAAPMSDLGIGVDAVFDQWEDTILPNSTTVAHPRFLAYVLGPPNGIAPYAEAVAAAINQNCNFWQLSPAASVVERSVLEWLASVAGYPASARGILTGGGSLATLQALATALNDRVPGFRAAGLQRPAPPLVIYTSVEAHRSVDKAAAILGIGLDHVRHVRTDDQHRMDAAALADNTALLGPVVLAGRHGIRACITNHRTTPDDIDPILNRIQAAGTDRDKSGDVGGHSRDTGRRGGSRGRCRPSGARDPARWRRVPEDRH